MEVQMGRSLLFLLLIFSLSFPSSSQTHLELIRGEVDSSTISSGIKNDLPCQSWRLAVEVDEVSWSTTPEECVEYVKEYISGGQYESDTFYVAEKALEFAKSVQFAGINGKDAWVFDIDETLLSNVGRLGSRIPEKFAFRAKIESETPSALPAGLWLYNELKALGFRLIILSDRIEGQNNITTANELLNAGYGSWTKLILREGNGLQNSLADFKVKMRGDLVEQGYMIRGNIGDQWSDLWDVEVIEGSFKLPNPMYYVA